MPLQPRLKDDINWKKLFVLGNESSGAFQATLDAINRQFQPETDLERELCVEIAHHRWRLRRLWIIETGLFDKEMDRQDAELRKTFKSFDEGTRLTCAFETLAGESGALSALGRYENRLHRAFNRAVDRLKQFQEERRSLQNEPDGGTGLQACVSTRQQIRQNEPEVIPIRMDPRPSAAKIQPRTEPSAENTPGSAPRNMAEASPHPAFPRPSSTDRTD